MSQPVTVIQAGGQNYAIRTDLQQALKLAHSARFLELRDGPDVMYLNANSITLISEWNELPAHHGRTWHATDAKPGESNRPKRR